MMNDDDRLNTMLRARQAPPMPHDLPHRIATMARLQPQAVTAPRAQARPFFRFALPEIMQFFAMPQPALACAVMLAVGVMIGFHIGTPPVDDNAIVDWSNVFSNGDKWL